jgi:TatD DNase family protein
MYEAKWIIDRGFFLGIGGVVTFKNSELSQSIANVPLNSLLLETDAPYLAPAPFRGKRNEPSYLVYIAKKMSEIFNKDVLEIMDVTSKNAQKLFTL